MKDPSNVSGLEKVSSNCSSPLDMQEQSQVQQAPTKMKENPNRGKSERYDSS